MATKIIGYIITLIGIIGLALTYEPIRTILKITLPTSININTLTLVSTAAVIIGIIVLIGSRKSKSSKQKDVEVPIYRGKEIVGYRRH